jgi:hypothetical protein
MSEVLELSPQERVAKLQGLLREMIDTRFVDVQQMHGFMDLYNVHAKGLKPNSDEYIGFLESLDQPEVRFSEDTFDRIVYRHDDIGEGADFLTPVI